MFDTRIALMESATDSHSARSAFQTNVFSCGAVFPSCIRRATLPLCVRGRFQTGSFAWERFSRPDKLNMVHIPRTGRCRVRARAARPTTSLQQRTRRVSQSGRCVASSTNSPWAPAERPFRTGPADVRGSDGMLLERAEFDDLSQCGDLVLRQRNEGLLLPTNHLSSRPARVAHQLERTSVPRLTP